MNGAAPNFPNRPNSRRGNGGEPGGVGWVGPRVAGICTRLVGVADTPSAAFRYCSVRDATGMTHGAGSTRVFVVAGSAAGGGVVSQAGAPRPTWSDWIPNALSLLRNPASRTRQFRTIRFDRQPESLRTRPSG